MGVPREYRKREVGTGSNPTQENCLLPTGSQAKRPTVRARRSLDVCVKSRELIRARGDDEVVRLEEPTV